MEGVTEGRMVHYVMTGHEPGVYMSVGGQHRAAVVVRSFGDVQTREGTPRPGQVNLLIYPDGFNDLMPVDHGMVTADMPMSPRWETINRIPLVWMTNVFYSEEPKDGTWHWIERA